jgi:hypothetical protein
MCRVLAFHCVVLVSFSGLQQDLTLKLNNEYVKMTLTI